MRYIQYYKNCYFHARDIQRYNLSYAFNFRNSFYALAQFFCVNSVSFCEQ